MENLSLYGWNDFFARPFENFKSMAAGRVAVENKNNYILYTSYGEVEAECAGRLIYYTSTPAELPKVGDWVVITLHDGKSKAIIHDILPRRTKLSRKSAGRKEEEQVIAVNIDTVFIVQGLDDNYNVNRLERYLVSVNESGAEPVIILNKSDLCPDAKEKLCHTNENLPGIKIILTSSLSRCGIDALRNYIEPAKTYAFVGSSGVGKSTLINSLLGTQTLKTSAVRHSDSKGRHTTTRRELIILPGGGLLIDTPGMRELQLWDGSEGLQASFGEIEELAQYCRFRDCSHLHEADCAVLKALENGTLPASRYKNYLKLLKEIRYIERKQEVSLALEEKRKWKNIQKEIKRLKKRGGKW